MTRLLMRISHWVMGHQWEFVRNIYGHEVIRFDMNRSIWRCRCGAEQWREEFGPHRPGASENQLD